MCTMCRAFGISDTAPPARRVAELPEGIKLADNDDGTMTLTMSGEDMKLMLAHALLGKLTSPTL